jgi:hypothetical protein
MADYMDEARYQATQDIAAALCRAAGDVMALHGNDPKSVQITAAGFAMALLRLWKHIDPEIPRIVREVLERQA